MERQRPTTREDDIPNEAFLGILLWVEIKKKAGLVKVHDAEMERPLGKDASILNGLLELAIVAEGREGNPASERTLPLIEFHSGVWLSKQGVDEAVEELLQIVVAG